MDSLLEAFEKNDSIWLINEKRYKNHVEIARKFSYQFKKHENKSEIESFLIEKIKISIKGEDIKKQDFLKIESQVSLNFFSSDKRNCKNSFFMIGTIRYLINQIDSYSSSIESWLSARDYVEAYSCINIDRKDLYLQLYNERKLLAESIIYLKNKGFETTIKLGEASLRKQEEDRFLMSISYRFKKIGFQGLKLTIDRISRFYDFKSKRYYLRPELPTTTDPTVFTPWGYLFNISLSNLHSPSKKINSKKIYIECENLVKHYFFIKRIQPLSKFSDLNHNHETILKAIQNNILYDQHFAIDQINPDHLIKIIDGLFNQKSNKSIINTEIYIDLLKWASIKSRHDEPLIFSLDNIYNDLRNKHTKNKIKITLDELSFKKNEINKSYIRPEEITKRNYHEKPFINSDNNYLYPNPAICNYGFYNHLNNLYKNKGADGNELGKITETFIENLLNDSGIKFISNKSYKIDKETAKELKITSKERECDLIIETNETIMFIELKRKTLTSESRSGDPLQTLIDISQSLLYPLAQAGCHEYTLRRKNKITFKDGTELHLSGKKIERIALTLFGFFGLQDGIFVHQILSSLINSSIQSSNPKEDEKINKVILEIKNQYSTKIFNELYLDGGNPFFNCRFFSVPQIIEILSRSTDNEQFEKEINVTKYTSTGCKDWFKEYYYLREILK